MHIGLKLGASGTEVERLHRVLLAAGLEIDLAESREKAFGPSTVAALKELQAQHGLTSHGRVDEKTLAVLRDLEAKPAINPPPVPSQPPTPVLTIIINRGTVHGKFVDADGAPIIGRRHNPVRAACTRPFATRFDHHGWLSAFLLTYQRTSRLQSGRAGPGRGQQGRRGVGGVLCRRREC